MSAVQFCPCPPRKRAGSSEEPRGCPPFLFQAVSPRLAWLGLIWYWDKSGARASPAGRRPVSGYVEALAAPERAALALLFEEITPRGLKAWRATFRQIEGKLWQIRAGVHRLFYILLTRSEMVLLHAYRKKSKKAPAPLHLPPRWFRASWQALCEGQKAWAT